MALPFFENAILMESFKRDWWRVDIYFKDYFFLFYFYTKEHKDKPWICIWKLKRKEVSKSYKIDFRKDRKCQNLKDFLYYYRWDLRDPSWFRNLSYCEYKRFVHLIEKWEIKNIHEFEQIKTYLKWKTLRQILKLKKV